MPDVRAPKVHQNNRSYICGPTFRFTMQEFSMVGGYTENPEKLSNWGWVLAWDNIRYNNP